ncbi:pyridine nucleotide-disulfide oxidoreductase domain-containing protein 2-like [Bolinopsis microptera]|uniref:pyridine nucleotide-disulfide oxidoreductase domain-containing protein 2-like n=1 Tax=Bolinopsis microptera TaxID=2820187 RepID=UPI00307AA51D
MSSDPVFTKDQIAQFSKSDAQNFHPYEDWLSKYARHMEKLLDIIPPGESKLSYLRMLSARGLLPDLHEFLDLLTSPATKILDRWFESEPLRATLATDSVIGAWHGPSTLGSSYVLLHHVMGGIGEREGAWGYVEGGMGNVSNAIARSALEAGATIKTDAGVEQINVNDNKVCGVTLHDGTVIESNIVLSNATPKVTFQDILDSSLLPKEYMSHIKTIDYTSPVFKLNVAMDKIPTFRGHANGPGETAGPQHQGTIHLNSETTGMVDRAFSDACQGLPSDRPILEMTIPSSVDPTLAPEGHHVASFFIQYVPFSPAEGEWTEERKDNFVKKVFSQVDEYAPGFSDSVVGYDALAPPDLERIFGLTGGNIYQGSMGLDQLFTQRPTYLTPAYTTPVNGLYLCGASTHPGGGVLGAPGRNCSKVVLQNRRK